MHFVELIFFALEQHAVDPLQQVGTALCSKEIVFANVYLLRGGQLTRGNPNPRAKVRSS